MFKYIQKKSSSDMSKVGFNYLSEMTKHFEGSMEKQCMPGMPIIIRLDGQGFHKFTKGLKKPYDERLSHVMTEVMYYLVDKFQAQVGYTQSDEITLIFRNDIKELSTDEGYKQETEIMYSARLQKLCSATASACSVRFNKLIAKCIPEKEDIDATFDSRVFQVPTLKHAAQVLVWRELDCIKNAVSMAAHTYFSHKTLQGKKSQEMRNMLNEKGIVFDNYPEYFRYGTLCIKKKILKAFTEDELDAIPEQYRPTQTVLRSVFFKGSLGKLAEIHNIEDVLFDLDNVSIIHM